MNLPFGQLEYLAYMQALQGRRSDHHCQRPEIPHGVAFRNGALYVAEISRVIRFDNIEERLSPPRAGNGKQLVSGQESSRLEVHPIRAGRQALRSGGSPMQRLRGKGSTLCHDHALLKRTTE
jgi:hypothetical protein